MNLVQKFRTLWITVDMCERKAVDYGHFHIQAFREIISWEKDQEKNCSERKLKISPLLKKKTTLLKNPTVDYEKQPIKFEMSLGINWFKKPFQQEDSINFI